MSELITKPENDVIVYDDMGMGAELTQDDCERGRIIIVSSNSKLAKEDRARQGAIIDLSNCKELGYKSEKPLEIIPIGFLKYWIEKDAETDKFITRYPAISEKEKSWEDVVDGRKIKRHFHFSYIVVLPSELKEGIVRPYEFSFRSTALKNTKRINKDIMEYMAKGIPSYGLVFKTTAIMAANDKNSWWAPNVEFGRLATKEEVVKSTEVRKQFVAMREAIISEQRDYEESDTDSNDVAF